MDVNTQSNDTDNEQGYKWWLRYVVVPLFGGGGVIAIIVALLTRPTPTVAQEIQLLTDEGGTETADVILTRDTHLITQQDLRRLDRNKFYVDEKLETAI
ncbi:hypothetical protein [Leptolyngbya sp. Heron Island J]|uniref:hypothetical protein n=1 Tax=Leptolyngbya sp. Heron Island J TaxID=1385935 RepID=UPI0004050DF1|nr:hypothetical protein [Leptolyngbya sp. Heron Island J]